MIEMQQNAKRHITQPGGASQGHRAAHSAAGNGEGWHAGRLLEEGPALTASAWRLLRWAADYGGLMRAQRSQAGHVFSGMAELFELYLLHAFHTFADVPLAELAQGGQPRQVSPPCPPPMQHRHCSALLC